MPNIYDNRSDEEVIGIINDLKGNRDAITKDIKFAENVLIERKTVEIAAALKEKDEPFGVVSQKIGDNVVKFDTKKEVSWEQDGLRGAYKQMILDGANPEEYVQAEFKIKEAAYKNWPSDIKSYFEHFRTVKAGSVSVKIELAKEK